MPVKLCPLLVAIAARTLETDADRQHVGERCACLRERCAGWSGDQCAIGNLAWWLADIDQLIRAGEP